MKIKLRDMTQEQYKKWSEAKCAETKCCYCLFQSVYCDEDKDLCWVNHKEIQTSEFLDQEIEVEGEGEGGILTEEEKEYLANIIKPFRNEVEYIEKYNYSNNPQYLRIKMIDNTSIFIPLSKIKKYYKNIEVKREYTLEELGIYDND